MANSWVPFIFRYGIAVITVVAAISIRVVLDPVLGEHYIFTPLLVAVLVTSWYGGRSPAMVAVVLGALSSSYFLLSPLGAFRLDSADHQLGLLLYMLTGFGMAFLAGSMHSAQHALREANDVLETRVRERTEELAQRNEDLQRSKERFRLLLEGASGHAIVMLDPLGNVASWSSSAERIMGYRAEEIIGRHYSVAIPSETKEEAFIEKLLAAAVAAGRIELERLRVRKDGSQFWANITITPLFDGDHEVEGFVKVVQDITERKRIEQSVEESEARYRTLFEYAPDGIAIINPERYCLDGNASICRMLGYTRPEFIGLHVSDIVAPEEIEHTEMALDSLRLGENFFREWRFRRKDGTLLTAEIIATSMPDGNLLGLIRDISERKQNEETRNLFRLLLDRSDDAIEVIDPATGRFLDGNEKAWQSLGYSRQEFLSLTVSDIDPEVADASWVERIKSLQESDVRVFEALHRNKDGTVFPVEVNLKFVSLHRPYILTIVRNLSERKRHERRMQAEHAVTRILAASPSLEEASAQILEAMCQILDWQRAEFWNVDRGSHVLRCYTIWQQSPDDATDLDLASREMTFEPGAGLPGRTWVERRAMWIPDVVEDESFQRTDLIVKAGFRSAVGFPIMIGSDVLGVLCFFNDERVHSNDELISVLSAVSSHIGQFVERKYAESASRVSEERFRQLAENIREVFWLNDLIEGRMLYVSPAYETVWGRTCESLYASPEDWLEAIHVEDRQRIMERSRDDEIRGAYDVVYRIVRPDESIRWIHDRGFPVRNDSGEVYRVAGVAEDITERVHAEDASQLHQLRMEGIVNSAMDGIITIGEDQRVVLINHAAERMFGCLSDDVLGERVERFIPESYREAHENHVHFFGKTGVAARSMGVFGAISGLRSNGEVFPLEASISQIEIEGHKLYTVTCRDVTERVRADETRLALETQLHQSQKMEAFGQLAGGVAHDFNNLLTVILGYSEWLLAYLPPETEGINMIAEIKRSGERAATLTRQLLAFSRQQVTEPRIVNLNSTLTEIEKLLRRLIGEDIALTSVLEPSVWPVMVDPGQIEQVVMNLAVNARDAMPQGGKLTIETRNVELDATYTKSHAEVRAGHFVLLAISDTGCGMSPEVRARIFEPFFTTKGIGQGTGLGLAVVHGIIKQAGGSAEVYSEPGAGTTIKIYLPIASEAPQVEVVDLAYTPRGSETILLVEDEAGVRDIAALSLEGLGYQVVQASDGDSAIQIMSEREGSIHLLLTDVVMPEISGRELAELLVERYPKLKVLFVSGYTDDAIVRHGVLRAEVAFLQKPFTLNALARKVREVLDA